jgi:hypothetical protein
MSYKVHGVRWLSMFASLNNVIIESQFFIRKRVNGKMLYLNVLSMLSIGRNNDSALSVKEINSCLR